MVQAEVDSRDDAYRWLMHWLSSHPKFCKATSVSVTTNLTGTFGTSIPAITSAAATGAGPSGPPVTFLPAPGDHLLSYKGRWMLISRQRLSGNPQLAANARYATAAPHPQQCLILAIVLTADAIHAAIAICSHKPSSIKIGCLPATQGARSHQQIHRW